MEAARIGSSTRGVRNATMLFAVATLLIGGLAPGAARAHEMETAPVPAASEGAWQFAAPAPGDVLRGFDPPEQVWLAGHRGVDLATEEGSQVRAAGDGVVAFAGRVVDRPLVSIDHPVGIRTTYEPVAPTVKAGESIAQGDVIGHVDAGNGHCPVPCLHWGARTGPKEYIDPLRLLRPPVFRLYPPEPW